MDPPHRNTTPDTEDIDLATIDAVLADIGWERRPRRPTFSRWEMRRWAEPSLYRQSQFVYESVVRPDYRNVMCTFSSAAAARRFMIMELSAMLRMRTRLPKIQLNRLAPGCTIEKGPTDFELAWPGGEATFPIGYIGHQRALDFSWVAIAELADIAASYRHPNGEPSSIWSHPLRQLAPHDHSASPRSARHLQMRHSPSNRCSVGSRRPNEASRRLTAPRRSECAATGPKPPGLVGRSLAAAA